MTDASIGFAFAFLTLILWGLSDYAVQRITRSCGIWVSLFWNGLIGTLGLTPFVIGDLTKLIYQSDFRGFIFLALAASVTLFTLLFDLQALKEGKLAVIEPLFGMELPVTVLLGWVFLSERLSFIQASLVGFVFVGIMFVVSKRLNFFRGKNFVEKGVHIAMLSMLIGASMNFLIGASSRINSPLLTIWFISFMVFMFALAYMPIANITFRQLISYTKRCPSLIMLNGFMYNIGWFSFATAATYVPTSIATTVSESYILIPVLLGIYSSGERVTLYQRIGIVMVMVGLGLLSLGLLEPTAVLLFSE